MPPSDESTESEQLLTAAKEGDTLALARLFDQHRERLEAMVKLRLDRRLQRRIDPADVVQEAYLQIQRKFAAYAAQDKLPFFLWLRLEVGQQMIDLHRHHLGTKMRDAGQEVYLHRGGMPSVASITLAEQLLGRISTASNAAMRAELKIKVQDALNSMEPGDREILVLRHFEELTNSEVAMTLELSHTAACNRYVRALQRLRKVFEQMPGGVEGVWS